MLATQTHEVGAHLLFAGPDGDAPYWAMVSQFDEALGNQETFEAAGYEWELNHEEDKVNYWYGSLAPRPEDDLDLGTDEDGDPRGLYEYNIGVVATDDAVGRRRVNVQFRPAWPDMRHVETGEPIQSLPDDLPEGVRVEIDSANVPVDDLVDVVQELADFLGISPEYFARDHIHEWSRCYNLALYVRIQKAIAEEQITSLDALLDRLARFQREREGRGEFKWDHDQEMGHRDAVALDPTALGHFYDRHSVGKLLKCYLMKDPDKQAGYVTEHPKLEVQFSSEYSDGAVSWSEVRTLRDELDRYLMHGLKWADLPVDAEETVYVADEYWNVEARDPDVEPELVPDPTDELVEAEREVATRALLDAEASAGERAVVETLVTDGGGAMDYDELADASGTSTSTVYRAVERFADVIDLIQGRVQTADRVVQDRLKELVEGLNDTLDWVANGLRHLEEEAGVGVSEDGPLAQWARRYGVEIVENSRHSDPDLELRLEAGAFTYDELARILRNGYEAARKESERLAMQLREAQAAYDDRDRGRRRTIQAFRWNGGQLRAAGQVPVG